MRFLQYTFHVYFSNMIWIFKKFSFPPFSRFNWPGDNLTFVNFPFVEPLTEMENVHETLLELLWIEN